MKSRIGNAFRHGLRSALGAASVMTCAIAFSAESSEAALSGPDERTSNAVVLQCIPQEQCCKICSRGRACGNTCISASKNCHKGRGCACNEEEICE